jgi:PAS domain S-box-containing protein
LVATVRDQASPSFSGEFWPGLRSALDVVGIPLCLINPNGEFVWLNACAKSFFGDVIGRRISPVVAPEQISYARQQLSLTVTGQVTATNYDLALINRSGRSVPTRIHSAPLVDGDSVVAVFGAALPRNPETENSSSPRANDRPDIRLTGRQHETLLLLGEGLGTAEIAEHLGITVQTTRNHIRAVMRALGSHSRIEAVALAHRLGLLQSG